MKRSAEPPIEWSFSEISTVAEILEREELGGAKSRDGSGDGDSGAAGVGAGGSGDDSPAPTKERKKIKTTAMRLNNNHLTEVTGLFKMATAVLADLSRLYWIDLSFNNLSTIGPEFGKLPNLKRLYLHSNQISKLADVEALQNNRNLEAITLHGCPVQDKSNYRVFVVSTLPWLRTLDFSGVTKRELDAAVSWRKMTRIVRRTPADSK